MTSPRPDLASSATRGVIWTTTQMLGSRVLTALVFVVLSRLLNPDDFGVVAAASVVTAFLTILVEAGFVQALVQRSEVTREHLDSALWMSMAIGLASAALTIALADPLADLFGEQELAPVLRVLSLSFLFAGAAGVPRAILWRTLDFRSVAFMGLLANAAGAAVGISVAVAGGGAWALVAQTLTTLGTQAAGLLVRAGWRPGWRVSRRATGELFGFSARVAGSQILNYLNRRTDDLLVGVYIGATALGIYTIAYRLLLIMTDVLIRTVSTVALPVFSQLNDEPARRERALLTATRLSATIAAPAFLLVSVLSPELVRGVFGDRWTDAIPVMQVLALIGVVHAILYVNGQALIAVGHPDTALRLNVMSTVATVAGFALTVQWGLLAVASSYVVVGYLMFPVQVYVSRRRIGFDARQYLAQVVPSLLACAPMVLVVGVLRSTLTSDLNSLVALWPLGIAGLITYGGSLRLIAPQTFAEVLALRHRVRGGPSTPAGPEVDNDAQPAAEPSAPSNPPTRPPRPGSDPTA